MANIEFTRDDTSSCVSGTLVYVPNDYAFDFRTMVKPDQHSSVQINSLQLAVNCDGTVLYAYGYCPLLKHRETDLFPPAASRPGGLFASRQKEWAPGIAYTIGGPTDWPVWINKKGGWVCLGEPRYKGPVEAIEFATDSIAVLDGTKLVAVWLRPEALPELPEALA